MRFSEIYLILRRHIGLSHVESLKGQTTLTVNSGIPDVVLPHDIYLIRWVIPQYCRLSPNTLWLLRRAGKDILESNSHAIMMSIFALNECADVPIVCAKSLKPQLNSQDANRPKHYLQLAIEVLTILLSI